MAKLDTKNKENYLEDITYQLWKEKGKEEDRAQEILFRLQHGGLKSLNNKFGGSKKSGERKKTYP